MENGKRYDVVVMGGGPGGYVAAIRAAQLGNTVAIVEKDALGGICLNWGCVPTKALLRDSEVLHLVKNSDLYGISIPDFKVNFKASVERSRKVASRLSKGVEYLMKKNSIRHLQGTASLVSPGEVQVTHVGRDPALLKAGHVIIATGARNMELPGLEMDGKRIVSSKEAMILEKVPKRMIIIGAGAIGVEFASLYHEYGTEIHLVEMLPHILPQEDEEISRVLGNLFEKRGINIHTSTRVEKAEALKTKVKVHISSGDETSVLDGDIALVAVGVQGNVENLGLEKAGVQVESGWINVDEYCKTTVDRLYAIGDVIGPPWLAHVASAQGRLVAEHLSGKNPQPINMDHIPACTYSRPQVASLGMTEQEARQAGYEMKVGRFPMTANGKALAYGEPDGMVKVIVDSRYGELLGCHIIGMEATELIAEIGVAQTLETTYVEILQTVHAHPTLSESIMEAVAQANGEAIHI
ncbi:MAG: dihydrolipoyl dehydrogenase [Candidatus Neomarinimicrobiota bacterium]